MHTKHTTIYTMIQKNQKEYESSSKTSFRLFISHPVPKTFTPLHYTFQHFTFSHLHFIHLHFTTLSFGLTPFKFPTAPFHLTSQHFTSLHVTELVDDFRHTSIPFNSSRL